MKTIKFEKEKPQVERVVKKGQSPTERPDLKRLKESNDFTIRHKTVLNRVESILRHDILARKDYWWLQAVYYAKCNMIKEIVILKDYYKKHSPESINRCRRELYKKAREGDKELQWLLTDQTFLDSMKKEEENYREYYGSKACQ